MRPRRKTLDTHGWSYIAGLSKHPNSSFYTAIFYDGAGHKVRRSTKQRDRRAALRTAIEWEDLSKAGREKRLTEAQARKVVAEILVRSSGETLHFHTARAWLDEWIAGKAGVVSESSLVKYRQVLGDFLKHLGERAEQTLAAIGPKDVRSFRDALAKGGRAATTVNMTIRKVLSTPFQAALRLGYIPTNPCSSVEGLRDDVEAERETFTTEQVQSLLAAADDDWKGAILTGYFTGLRLRDVAEMRWEAVDFTAGVLRVKTRKTGVALVLPLHDELAAWLDSQRRGIGKAPIFPALAGKGTGGATDSAGD